MFDNPHLNSIWATLYIFGVATFMHTASKFLSDTPDTIMAPIVAMSLLVLSASVMAFLFFYKPVEFWLSGEKKLAVQFIYKIVSTFAVTTLILIAILFLFR